MKLRGPIPLSWRVRTGIASLVIPPLILVVPLNRLTAVMGKGKRADKSVPDDLAAEWVDNLLHRMRGPWKHTCLRRSAVLYHVLRKSGQPVELNVGVRRTPEGELAAHAWLTLSGATYLERTSELQEDFRVIARFPEI